MKTLNTLILTIAWLLLSSFQSENVEMADELRSEGMIYVVVIVVLVMVLGLAFYLFSLDRKITKLEKESSDTEKE